MRTISSTTLVRNCEKVIKPHLAMLSGEIEDINILLLTEPFDMQYGYWTKEADSSQEIAKNFPGVSLHESNATTYSPQLLAEAVACGKNEVTTIIQADMFMTKKDFNRFVNFCKNSDYDTILVDGKKCIVNYYYDMKHGIRDNLATEPLAVKTSAPAMPTFEGVGTKYIIDWPDFTIHHFCGWKGELGKQEWIEGKIPSEGGVFAHELVAQYGDWVEAPQELQELFRQNA